MIITVMDEDLMNDDTVGSATYDLTKVFQVQAQEKCKIFIHLEYISLAYKGRPAGKIFVSMRYVANNQEYGNSNPNSSWSNGDGQNNSNNSTRSWETQKNMGNQQSNSGSQNNMVNPNQQQPSNWSQNNMGNQNSGWEQQQPQNNSGWGQTQQQPQ